MADAACCEWLGTHPISVYRWRRRGFSHRWEKWRCDTSPEAAAPLPKSFLFAMIGRPRGTTRADRVRHDDEDGFSRTG